MKTHDKSAREGDLPQNGKTTTSSREGSKDSVGDTKESHSDLHQLFLEELSDMLNAETQLTKALPKVAENANSMELGDAIRLHLQETEEHIQRIQQVFEILGESPKRKKCKGMQGILKEGDEMIQDQEDTAALDAAIIASAQKVEHYEIASYGTLCAWAERMGHEAVLSLLQENLEEEKATDEKLTQIAETLANEESEESA